jgi:predicted CoA-substrate-specific enzyme activase
MRKGMGMTQQATSVLGLDIGSIAVGFVQLTMAGRRLASGYAVHHGDIVGALRRILGPVDWQAGVWVAASNADSRIMNVARRFDDQSCVITAARRALPGVRSILVVGGETFHLIRLGADGTYRGRRGSTSCAAGTGAFLDQQARRLGLDGTAHLSRAAMANTDPLPKIASRCAVFAKTDLIHAQQEGHRLEAICDGLCHGLAKNIADTVFKGQSPAAPVLFCGGVAQNKAVTRRLEAMAGVALHIPPAPQLAGAWGAALMLLQERPALDKIPPATGVEDLVRRSRPLRAATYPPLTLTLSSYPTFDSLARDSFVAGGAGRAGLAVEVDRYASLAAHQPAYLGVDIGSTSTKAVLLGPDKTVLAGFYTRTAGRPLVAAQAILESIEDLARRAGCHLQVLGAGTTGAGRKFIGRIFGADLVLDEITAHARAAWEIDPAVDTIIEIGGQDAKFTTLKDGRVTSAAMNTVCAAGTGSFIEEQAAKLGCPLEDFARRTAHRRAPLCSDRCTVFMERDLNHFLADGWDMDDVLAAVLHAVRENYLLKVAAQSRIGQVIFFQGATAKNPALVAAFEQRLNKPIRVSRFCHLTGALGTALGLWDAAQRDTRPTTFAGLQLWRGEIPVRSEICAACHNHCKLSVADVAGQTVAYGFLCGRDYDTPHFVPGTSEAFNLVGAHHEAWQHAPRSDGNGRPVIGLPSGVHMAEELPRWRFFFARLGFKTVSSVHFKEAVQIGKAVSGAEFCAPQAALQGQVAHLRERCDYIFLPLYLEEATGTPKVRRQYCYYTQYAPVLADHALPQAGARILSPLLRYLYTGFHARMELYRLLQTIPGGRVSFRELGRAYDEALQFQAEGIQHLRTRWRAHIRRRPHALRVVLLGRPYTLFSPALNCGIPELWRRLGVDCCCPEMLEGTGEAAAPIQPLLDTIHWRYAVRVLEAAQFAARTVGYYPVLVTSFKCAPDAFVQEYFKQLMQAYDKPYLVLELDEHDSRVGYETRIEAAVRAFGNHHQAAIHPPRPSLQHLNPDLLKGKLQRTIVLPNYDRLAGRLLVATLRREGHRALLIEETAATIRRSLRDNTGQCIPINTVVEGFAECLAKHQLAPAKSALWVSDACIACNIALYPHHMKSLLNARGGGLEKAGVYVGDIFFKDISPRASFNAVFAYMFSGLLRRMACKLRPYEINPGEVDRAQEEGLEIFTEAFLGHMPKVEAVAQVVARFQRIPVCRRSRPKVALFGDLYARDNRVMNQDLIRFIERHGGEVVTMPYSEYARMIANPYFRKWFFERKFLTLLSSKTLMTAITRLERKYYRLFAPVIGEPMAAFDDPPESVLQRFGVRIEHTGESLDNLLKVYYLKKHHPDLALFVQVSPAFCCPSLVTEAMARRIETITGVPVVSLTYDGTGGSKNEIIIPYLKTARPVAPSVDAAWGGSV